MKKIRKILKEIKNKNKAKLFKAICKRKTKLNKKGITVYFILLEYITDLAGNFITSHCWVEHSNINFSKIKIGDELTFFGKVVDYIKYKYDENKNKINEFLDYNFGKIIIKKIAS